MSDPGRRWRGHADLVALWNTTAPELIRAVKRFPLPVLFCLLFALYSLAGQTRLPVIPQDLTAYLGWELAAGFLWSLIAAIWTEAGHKSRWEHFLAAAGGFFIIVVLLTGANLLYTSPVLMLLTLLLVLSLAAHHKQQRQNEEFWQFNQRLWFGAGLSIMSVLAMVSIPLATLGSIEYLFALHLSDGIYSKIFLVSLGFLAPLFWLTMIPDDYHETRVDQSSGLVMRSASDLLVSYVLVPVMIINIVVFYRYAYKIWSDGVVPPGRLGPAVLAFACLGIATYVLSYPQRHTGGLLVRFYWRSWFVMSSVPAGLLAMAVYIRIKAYGLTEARYLTVLVAVWLLALFVAFVLLRAKDLRIIPASLAALVVLGTFGPPGATALSLRSQTGQLAKIMEANGFLVDGVFLHRTAHAGNVSQKDAARIKSILNYLAERESLGRLKPWFRTYRPNPFAPGGQKKAGDRYRQPSLISRLSALMGAPRSPVGTRHTRPVVFYARGPALVSLKNTQRLAGPVNLSLKSNGSNAEVQVAPGTGRDLMVLLNERQLVVRDKRGRKALFDLSRIARKISWFEDEDAVVPALTSPRIIRPARPQPGENALDLRLVMTSLQGQRSRDGRYAFKQISCWILIYGKK